MARGTKRSVANSDDELASRGVVFRVAMGPADLLEAVVDTVHGDGQASSVRHVIQRLLQDSGRHIGGVMVDPAVGP